ncbi:hypothetical protein [Methylophaga sp.]|uniref:hypothetical protein n=1 Tax=Methylophaga sp. TaxID=2024840 RepID=UPI003F69A2DA
MHGKLLQRVISDSSELFSSNITKHGLIFLSGVIAMLMHESFRYGLDLPGRQGLTLMAILVFVRCAAPFSYSGTLAGAGGLLAALIWRDNPTVAMIVLSQGILIDLLYKPLSRSALTLWLLPLMVGMVHMLKPLLKIGLIAFAGIETDSFRHGLAYPFLTHFIFGSVGGLIGFMAWRSLKKIQH